MRIPTMRMALLLLCAVSGGLRADEPAAPAAPKPPVMATAWYAGGPEEGGPASFDVCRPAEGSDLPVVVYIRDAAWAYGDTRQDRLLAEYFAQSGFVFARIQYRIPPEARHPSAVRDCARAVVRVRERAREFGGDPGKLFLLGHLSGGHFAALLGTDVRRLAEEGGAISMLRGIVVLEGGSFDVQPAMAVQWGRVAYRPLFGVNPVVWRDASPVSHVGEFVRYPSFLIFTAYAPGLEARRAGAERLAAALRRTGARVDFVDASPIRTGKSIRTGIGKKDDRPTAVMMAFLSSLQDPAAPRTRGSTRTLHAATETETAIIRERADERVERLFSLYDADRDDRLSAAEIRLFPFLFKSADTDADGFVSRSEALRYYR